MIARFRREYFDRHGVDGARTRDAGDVELVPAKRAGDLRARRDARAVHPDVRTIVDAVEGKPHRARGGRGRQIEFPPIPPRRFVRAVGRNGQQGELRADRIGRSRNRAQVHAGVRIREAAFVHERADHGAWDRRRAPAVGAKSGLRDRVASRVGRGGRLNRPTRIERNPRRLRRRRRRQRRAHSRDDRADQEATHDWVLRV